MSSCKDAMNQSDYQKKHTKGDVEYNQNHSEQAKAITKCYRENHKERKEINYLKPHEKKKKQIF